MTALSDHEVCSRKKMAVSGDAGRVVYGRETTREGAIWREIRARSEDGETNELNRWQRLSAAANAHNACAAVIALVRYMSR